MCNLIGIFFEGLIFKSHIQNISLCAIKYYYATLEFKNIYYAKKIERKNMQQHVSHQQILHIMQMLSEKKQIMPKDMLGRSLAYTCFLPRLSDRSYLYERLKCSITPKKALHTNAEKLSKLIQTSHLTHNADFDQEVVCVIFSSLEQVTNNEDINSIDCLSMIRRLSPAFVIHENVFIDEYQILKSAISGADMIMLDIKHLHTYCEVLYALESNPALLELNIDDIALQTNLIIQDSKPYNNDKNFMHNIKTHVNMLITFAYNLGVIPIVHVANANDLNILQSLENLLHCIYVTEETINLVSNENIIFADQNLINDKSLMYRNIIDISIVSE